MLFSLCGSKNVTKILLFLFVNGKCYGTQLHRTLKTPLTPIQKALNRLEKGGIIMSYCEGKTRLYQFNPAYPLLSELEQLIKKAYTLLSPHEKKQFSLIKNETISYRESAQLLTHIWQRLKHVKELSFHAKTKSKDPGGWNGKGKGEVVITHENENTLIFHEKGCWKDGVGQETSFSNVFRWSFDRDMGMISLEHLRHGSHNPVFLFHLAPVGNNVLSSIDSHLCDSDTYFGQFFCDTHSLRLNWRVIGPKKNEEIDYFYV